MEKPWICPVCNRGVAPDQKTCDHGGAALSQYFPMPQPPYTTVVIPWIGPTWCQNGDHPIVSS